MPEQNAFATFVFCKSKKSIQTGLICSRNYAMKLYDIIEILESFAPLALQESYDNAGLYCGSLSSEIHQILISLDITEEVVEEAIQRDCQLIVAHHPILFKPLKRLVGNNYVEKTFLKAIQNNIALYAAHTNLDNVKDGVNFKIAEKLKLKEVKILQPAEATLAHLTVLVPLESTDSLVEALGKAGAGQIGNYKNCSFKTEGTGTFMPAEQATPRIGQLNKQEEVKENRVEVLLPKSFTQQVVAAMYQAHPYEEVAYFLQDVLNKNQDVGAGAIGLLNKPLSQDEFLAYLKEAMNLRVIKHTTWSKTIRKVAVCGGSGSFLLKKAISVGADAFISSDFKYHEFFDAENKLIVADIGHYESEQYTKELLADILTSKTKDLTLLLSDINTNPVSYFS